MTPDDLARQASAKMAHYLIVLLTRGKYDPSTIAQAGEPISGWSLSISEHAEYFLCHDLDLTLPKTGHQKVLAKSTHRFPAHFASGRYDDHFSKILESYLSFAYWQGEVPTTRGVFKAPENHVEILTKLADLAYLSVSCRGFCRADKSGHAMLSTGAWNPDFQSREDIAQLELEKRAQEIAINLSSDLLVLARHNPKAAFWPVMNSLNPEHWYQEGANKLLVERIVDLVHSQACNSKTTLN